MDRAAVPLRRDGDATELLRGEYRETPAGLRTDSQAEERLHRRIARARRLRSGPGLLLSLVPRFGGRDRCAAARAGGWRHYGRRRARVFPRLRAVQPFLTDARRSLPGELVRLACWGAAGFREVHPH